MDRYGGMKRPAYTDEYGKDLIAKMLHRLLHHLEISDIEFSDSEDVYRIDLVKQKLIKFLDLYRGNTDEIPSQYLSDEASHIIAKTIFKALSFLSSFMSFFLSKK